MKRHTALQSLSREHHTALNFCLHLEKGIQKSVKVERMQLYVRWFWDYHLSSHFKVEEQNLFPLLPVSDLDVIKALEEHKKIKRLSLLKTMSTLNIVEIMERVRAHVRFEERVLFNKFQEFVTTEQ